MTDASNTPNIQAFFDPTTCTVTYVVADSRSGHAAIIDPVLDYDPKSGHDYPPASREPAWQTTVAGQLQHNIHV